MFFYRKKYKTWIIYVYIWQNVFLVSLALLKKPTKIPCALISALCRHERTV